MSAFAISLFLSLALVKRCSELGEREAPWMMDPVIFAATDRVSRGVAVAGGAILIASM